MPDSEQCKVLQELVDKYTTSFPPFTPSASSSRARGEFNGIVVLLSGSTGVFGSNILAKLAASPFVKRTYAVSRPSVNGLTVHERHARAFRREGISEALLNDGNVRFLDGDFSMEGFGMEARVFAKLQSTVTHIIHNGWQVNFNVPVEKFEANFRSVRKLVDFALHSQVNDDRPAKLIFISSLGVFRCVDPSDPNKVWPEERLVKPNSALETGYTEAKWVSEQILSEAASHTALQPTVVRIGQLVGGPNGYWSEREWFAALIKSSIFLGMLPDLPEILSWNTAPVAAQALLDMLNSSEPYLHLVHPKPVGWNVIISIFSRKLRVPVVPLDAWADALEHSHELALSNASQKSGTQSREVMRKAMQQNPALRMLVLFTHGRTTSRSKKGGKRTAYDSNAARTLGEGTRCIFDTQRSELTPDWWG
ncbi:hypothetical protein EW145_g1554 [Phellinidium pouzarii]|uniref:Thioester reductase (TE) domain-containing protein n=1 Tax=Phellinidium pouzarii TaxID=167371 RepID=A0A4S4LE32_9AGAM|nr:hypothetical protein EW145_g1554 [Phellinidium pouzarii]